MMGDTSLRLPPHPGGSQHFRLIEPGVEQNRQARDDVKLVVPDEVVGARSREPERRVDALEETELHLQFGAQLPERSVRPRWRIGKDIPVGQRERTVIDRPTHLFRGNARGLELLDELNAHGVPAAERFAGPRLRREDAHGRQLPHALGRRAGATDDIVLAQAHVGTGPMVISRPPRSSAAMSFLSISNIACVTRSPRS